eukprot:1388969-Prymnesium_polylepis.2
MVVTLHVRSPTSPSKLVKQKSAPNARRRASARASAPTRRDARGATRVGGRRYELYRGVVPRAQKLAARSSLRRFLSACRTDARLAARRVSRTISPGEGARARRARHGEGRTILVGLAGLERARARTSDRKSDLYADEAAAFWAMT